MPLSPHDVSLRAAAAKQLHFFRPRRDQRIRPGIAPLEAVFWAVFWLIAAAAWVAIPF